MNKLFKLQGEKLPGEKYWVTADDTYELYGRIEVNVDSVGPVEFIITDIIEEGLIVTTLN